MNDICTSCGEPNPPGTQFCLFCGVYLGWAEPARETETGEDPGSGAALEPGGPPAASDITGPVPMADQTLVLPPASGGAPAGAALAGTAPAGTPAAPTGPNGIPTTTPPAAPVSQGPTCPACGRAIDPTRRFCGHCGQVLATGQPARNAPSRGRNWWQRLLRSDSRLARRSYRKSLPPLVRWRRAGVTVVVAALLVGGFTMIGRDPIGWAVDRWYDVTNRLDPVTSVSATALPEDSVIGENSPNGLLDADAGTAWVTGWTPPEGRPACGESRGGRVVLSFPATRVREMQVITGVSDPSQRPLQHIPTQLHVVLPDGSCRSITLDRSAELQQVAFDTGEPVTQLTVSVGEAYTSDDERVQDVAALTQLTLLARPSR